MRTWGPWVVWSGWALGCNVAPCGEEGVPTASVGSGDGNVLVVLLDDVGVDPLGPWGIGPMPARTPTIDCLCSRGLRLTQTYASPVCSPTRAELLTGRYNRRHDLGSILRGDASAFELDTAEDSLADIGGRAGYATGLFGKWHLTDATLPEAATHPNRFGFDRFAGSIANLVNTTDGPVTAEGYSEWERIVDGVPGRTRDYPTTVMVDDALDFVAGVGGQPWIVVLSFHAPHVPLHDPPSELVGEPNRPSMSSEHRQYLTMLEAADTELGRFLRALPVEDRSNTTVLLMGDNGTTSGFIPPSLRARGGKSTLWEGGVRVPAVMSGLGVDAPGVSDAVAHVVDVVPTVMALIGGESAALLDGRSWLPLADDPTVAVHSSVLSSSFGNIGGPPTGLDRMIRDANRKLMVDVDGTRGLYAVGPERIAEGDDLLQFGELSAEDEASMRSLEAELAALEDSFAAESGRPVVQ